VNHEFYSVIARRPKANAAIPCLMENLYRQEFPDKEEIVHLHCTTPALVGGTRERSAVQVSSQRALLATT